MTNKSLKIFNEKLNFRENATSKIKSLEHLDYKPKVSELQIFNDHLPWLRYNKPNLSEEIKNQIEKKQTPDTISKATDKRTHNQSGSLNMNKTPESFPKFTRRKFNSLIDIQSDAIKTNKEISNSNSKTTISSPSSNYIEKKLNSNSIKHLKIIEKPRKCEKVDASTETEKVNQVSVEIQADFSNNSKKGKSNKLKQAIINSTTIQEKQIKKYNENSYYQANELKYSKIKKSGLKPVQKDDLITKELIDVILPSITNGIHENCGKQYSAYTYPNVYSKNMTDRSIVNNLPHKLAVTHASVNFLDKYWAAQRQMLINKENFHFRNDLISENNDNPNEEEMVSKFPYIYSSSELPVIQEIKNKNNSYLNNKYNMNSKLSNDKLNKITSLELEKTLA